MDSMISGSMFLGGVVGLILALTGAGGAIMVGMVAKIALVT
ncbi:hypothetical protein [Paraburkholderia terrae]|nr:hypothetical protein [Paraburkholderia terrae]